MPVACSGSTDTFRAARGTEQWHNSIEKRVQIAPVMQHNLARTISEKRRSALSKELTGIMGRKSLSQLVLGCL